MLDKTDVYGKEMSEKELGEYFGIKILRFEFSKPIENSFHLPADLSTE